MYLDDVIAQYESLGLPPTSGCTDSEILSLEQQLGLVLPAAYSEFLRWGGRDAGPIFGDLKTIPLNSSLICRRLRTN